MSCEHCPCPDVCRGLPAYCRWAAKDPPEPVEIRHICDASRARRDQGDPASRPAPQYPPLWRQAANLAGSMARVGTAALRGVPVRASEAVQAARRAICLGCEHNGERADGGIRCTRCGCSGLKLEFAALACPVGKWGPAAVADVGEGTNADAGPDAAPLTEDPTPPAGHS